MALYPAGSQTNTPSLLHQATVSYERRSLERLEAMFRFYQVCEPHPLAKNSGRTLQMNRYALPGFNTNPAAEGVVPSPLQQSSNTISVTVEPYSNFMSASTMLDDTDINPTTDRMVEDLSYMNAGTVDTIIRTEIDSNTTAQVNTIGAYLSAQDFKANVALLLGINVRPRFDNYFFSVLHPYIVYDLITDNTAGGFIDALKYTSGRQVLAGEVGEIAMCRLLTSTNVGTTGTAPSLQYYTYIIGSGWIGICDLAGRGPSQVSDPRNQRFSLNIIKGGPSSVDPTGEIATYVSTRYVFAAKTLDTVNNRGKIIKADASLV